jgi:YegS/Rv2252/BmrU family lipid kinase
MQRRFIFFINPISGTKGKEILLKKIQDKAAVQNVPYQVLPTNAAGNYYYLKEKISTEHITDIVICGGDGTIGKIAAVLVDEDVRVGIIPMGSGNGLALAANIPTQTDKALDLLFTGKARYIDAFFVNSIFSCMLCGVGFDGKVAHDFAAQSKRGLSTYIQQTLGNFFSATPYPFEVIHKGTAFSTDAYFISVANSNQFGNRITIAPKARLNDGLLDVVIVKKMSKMKLIFAVLKQLFKGVPIDIGNQNFHEKDILYFQSDKLIIHNLGSAPMHLDGDPAPSSKKIYFQVIPSAFKLIQPV